MLVEETQCNCAQYLTAACSGWSNASSNTWCNWKPEDPKEPGCKKIIRDRPTAIFLGKWPKLENGMFFYLLAINIV